MVRVVDYFWDKLDFHLGRRDMTNAQLYRYFKDYNIFVSKYEISRWRRGLELPSNWPTIVPRLGRLFGVPPASLVSRTDKKGVAIDD